MEIYFFPYAGLIEAKGKTQDELRNNLTGSLSENTLPILR